jgi:aminoglycoside phosphotransferase (APT) family kinase protein
VTDETTERSAREVPSDQSDESEVATQVAGSVSSTSAGRPQVSTRDADDLRARLETWFAGRPGIGGEPRIDAFERPETNGMSSETLLFDASWNGPDAAARVTGRFVARLCPDVGAFPVFPTYDMGRQAQVMRLVGARTEAPVPPVRWDEPDSRPLGAPFFVMDRIDGQVPPDVMPYTFDGSWLTDATPEQRARLQARSVDALAAIHGIAAGGADTAFLELDLPGDTPLRRHFANERAYYEWVRQGHSYGVIERAFDWLEAHWPESAEAAAPVVVWGDARIGNMLYQDFEPAAVLDWEMATVGPREIDLGWFIFLHRFFEDLTSELGMAGLPDFLQRDEVASQYAAASGHEPRDLDWFITYAALRHGSIMARVLSRSVAFGEQEMPADPQEMVMHRKSIDALVAGTYWSDPIGPG